MQMPMLMMLCSSFSNSNTRGVTSFPPIKESRPEIKSPRVSNGKGNATYFYFLIFGTRQGWFGIYSFITATIHTYKLHEAKKPGKFLSKKS
jgi:hypothetical protein